MLVRAPVRGVVRGLVRGVVGGWAEDAAAPSLVWSIAGTTQATEEAANAVYTVSYGGDTLAPAETVTVEVASADGSASNGVDYTGVSTTLTFTEGGATAKTLAVTIIEDTIVEGTEDFTVTLAAPSRGSVAGSGVNTLIVDEDATSLAWTLAGPTSIDEGETGTYTVSYSGVTLAPAQTATVTVATAAGGNTDLADAGAGTDYTALSTVLTFTGAGATQKTVAVSTIEDTETETAEDFTVALSGQSIGTLASGSVVTEIADDDAAFVVDAVTFDGTNDYLTRGGALSGVSDGRKMWGSVWYRRDAAIGTNEQICHIAGDKVNVRHHSFGSPSARFQVYAVSQSGGSSFWLRATNAYILDGNWHHIAWYMDTDHAAGNKVGYIFHDGVDVTTIEADAAAAFDIDFTQTDFAVGASTTAGGKFNGDIAEFIFAPGQDFDVSNPANLAKLRNSSTGKPVDVGADGSTPSGVAPAVYLTLGNGETPADNFATNAGTGGGMTVNGALAVAASSPTD